MSHNLGLKIVAEGVESGAQVAALRAHGCDGAQGYFFSLPVARPVARLIRSCTSTPMRYDGWHGDRRPVVVRHNWSGRPTSGSTGAISAVSRSCWGEAFAAMAGARSAGKVTADEIAPLLDGGSEFYMLAPLMVEGRADSYLREVFGSEEFLRNTLRGQLDRGYGIQIEKRARVMFAHAVPLRATGLYAEETIATHGMRWRVSGEALPQPAGDDGGRLVRRLG